LAVEQKFPNAFRGGNFVAGALVRLDIGVVEECFAFLNSDKRVGNVGLAGADRFDLAALELDAGFVALEDVKIAQRFAVEDRLGRHRLEDNTGGTPVAAQPRWPCSGTRRYEAAPSAGVSGASS